ncbi:membrane-spanning 4-domains subfamily A member 10 isoform X4 [Acinonyx jubatus]|uniref:Membrane-spanning 4-domains subfamily A member 10 isoform X4 n=1 Tax=Acinonyx jubatus TaxID=32536 RepID=A0ABM3NI37_ACIJB|nr:membrane-spanning 4-domains subfamily A member 10 isoform X4 [Acinonyx jubatus]XP_053059082.1 membrane-spanning 4-domains subfamily A member 10 isoform X4 [Acinonyx jubatus]
MADPQPNTARPEIPAPGAEPTGLPASSLAPAEAQEEEQPSQGAGRLPCCHRSAALVLWDLPGLYCHGSSPGGAEVLVSVLGGCLWILVITTDMVSNTYLKILCLTAHGVSFFCVLAGLFVIAKDLFLERTFDFPIWTPYPNSTVYIQRLELALLCFSFLEFFLLSSTAVTVCRAGRRSAEEGDLSFAPDTSSWGLQGPPMSPPPAYGDVTMTWGDM